VYGVAVVATIVFAIIVVLGATHETDTRPVALTCVAAAVSVTEGASPTTALTAELAALDPLPLTALTTK
jgi:hypothetical protein